MAPKFKSSLSGFALDLELIGDGTDHTIAEHESPFRNGAKLQNLGTKARRVRFKADFMGEGYDAHFLLRDKLKSLALVELLHPELGPMKGQIQSESWNYDDRINFVQADFEFLEELIPDTEPSRVVSVEQAMDAHFVAGQKQQMDDLKTDLRNAVGNEAGNILAQELDPNQSILSQLSGLSAKSRAYIKKIDAAVTGFEALLIDVQNPANSIISTIDYGLRLPGRVVGGLALVVERYAVMIAAVRESPVKFLESLRHNLQSLEKSFADVLKQLRISGAQRLALEAGKIFESDEKNRRAYRKEEGKSSFDAKGRFIPSPETLSIITVTEAEFALKDVREYLQVAVTGARSMQTIKDMARDLALHIGQIKVQYETIRELEIDNTLPVHLVCLKAGLPYNAAPRLLALNPAQIRPSFMKGQVAVYAR